METGRAANINQVGAARPEIVGCCPKVGRGHPGCVVDLGENIDRVAPVVLACLRLAKEAGDLAKVFGALLHWYPVTIPENSKVSLAKAGNEDQVCIRGDLEVPSDPGGR